MKAGGELIHRLLRAREERAFAQGIFLGAPFGPRFVVQISINIPGLPKRMECDAAAMGFVRGVFLREFGEGCSARVLLSNFAGVAEILLFASHGAMLAKKAALRVEDGNEWGRVFDIDVIAESGPISRSDIGGVARKCLLCDDEAKICARAGRHPITALREEAARLLGLARPIR